MKSNYLFKHLMSDNASQLHKGGSLLLGENNYTMGDKSVETLGNKIDFRASWTHFPPPPLPSPPPPNNADVSLFVTAQTTAPTQN